MATDRSSAEVCKKIGADFVLYQRLDDLIESIRTVNSDVVSFEASVFDGHYITGDVSPEFLSRIDAERRDETRTPEGASLLEFSRKSVAS